MLPELQFVLSRSNLFCTWECGGSYSSTGAARIICTGSGSPKRPVYLEIHKSRSGSRHALLPVRKGDYIVDLLRHRNDIAVIIRRLFEVPQIESDGKREIEGLKLGPNNLALVACGGNEMRYVDEAYQLAVQAALEKSECYHCHGPHFVQFRPRDMTDKRWGYCENAKVIIGAPPETEEEEDEAPETEEMKLLGQLVSDRLAVADNGEAALIEEISDEEGIPIAALPDIVTDVEE